MKDRKIKPDAGYYWEVGGHKEMKGDTVDVFCIHI
jgi:hypothetical protein